MKKTALKFYPYVLLVTILAVLTILIGRAIQNPQAATKRVAAKKTQAQVSKKSNEADKKTKSPKASNKKVLREYIGELALAEATETSTSNPPASASTTDPLVRAAPQPAAGPEPKPQPKPAPATPDATVPQPQPEPTPVAPAPQPEPTPVASLPQPEPTPAPTPAIASNTVLTAEQALSLQGLYPGISEGWTIELYEIVAAEFYARYARWGGNSEPASAAFQEFLTAIGEEKPKAGLSFPRSWLVVWRNGDFIETAKTERFGPRARLP